MRHIEKCIKGQLEKRVQEQAGKQKTHLYHQASMELHSHLQQDGSTGTEKRRRSSKGSRINVTLPSFRSAGFETAQPHGAAPEDIRGDRSISPQGAKSEPPNRVREDANASANHVAPIVSDSHGKADDDLRVGGWSIKDNSRNTS